MKNVISYLILIFGSMGLFGQEIKEENVITEGFYSRGWELSEFIEIIDSNIYRGGWLKFSEPLSISDSLQMILDEVPELKSAYIKIEGIKRTGGSFGHLGAADKEFEVIKLLEVDTSYTITHFLKE